jgi:hypothetical protein
MCFGSAKQTTQTSSTTAPTNPAIAPAVTNEIGAATSLASQPLQLYQGQMVAPLNDTQNAAISAIQNSSSLAQPYLTQAAADTTAASTPFSASAVNQYMSPYQNDVVNSTMALENEQDAEQQQSLAGNITAAGAWGGDRSAVVQSELGRQQALANNSTNASIENQGYTTALNEYNTQNQNLQNTAYSLGNLGTAMQNSALSGASATLNAGTLQQQVAQENLNVPYEQYLQQQAYPYQNLDFLSGILGSAASTTGTTSTGTNVGSSSQPAGSQILGLGLSALSFLKEGGRARLADGGGSLAYNPVYNYAPLPAPPPVTGFIPDNTSLGRTGLGAAPSVPSASKAPASGAGGSSSSPFGLSSGQISGAVSGLEDVFGGSNPFGNTPLSDMGTGGSGAGNVYLDSLGNVTSPFRSGGRTRLDDGGVPDDEDPGDGGDQSLTPIPVTTQPTVSASLASPPPDASNDNTVAPKWDDGTPVAKGGDGYDASMASLSHPAKILPNIYQPKPDWHRALLTAGLSMMSARGPNALSDVGQGLEAGANEYYAQEDKDNHPEVDHSGPTTTVRYTDGTVVDTGIPTEAAINAKATGDYRTATATQASADREARIAEERDANAARVAEAAQAEKDRAAAAQQANADRAFALQQGKFGQMVPGKGDDGTGKIVDGIYSLNEKTGTPLFTPGGTLQARVAPKGPPTLTAEQALTNAQKDYDRLYPAPKVDPANPSNPLPPRAVPPEGMGAWLQKRKQFYLDGQNGPAPAPAPALAAPAAAPAPQAAPASPAPAAAPAAQGTTPAPANRTPVVIPPRPAAAPPGAKYSPSTHAYWWQGQDGKWNQAAA